MGPYLVGQGVTAEMPLTPTVAHDQVHGVPWAVEAFGVLTDHCGAVVELLERLGVVLNQGPRMGQDRLHVTRRRHQANVPSGAAVDAFVVLEHDCKNMGGKIFKCVHRF